MSGETLNPLNQEFSRRRLLKIFASGSASIMGSPLDNIPSNAGITSENIAARNHYKDVITLLVESSKKYFSSDSIKDEWVNKDYRQMSEAEALTFFLGIAKKAVSTRIEGYGAEEYAKMVTRSHCCSDDHNKLVQTHTLNEQESTLRQQLQSFSEEYDGAHDGNDSLTCGPQKTITINGYQTHFRPRQYNDEAFRDKYGLNELEVDLLRRIKPRGFGSGSEGEFMGMSVERIHDEVRTQYIIRCNPGKEALATFDRGIEIHTRNEIAKHLGDTRYQDAGSTIAKRMLTYLNEKFFKPAPSNRKKRHNESDINDSDRQGDTAASDGIAVARQWQEWTETNKDDTSQWPLR